MRILCTITSLLSAFVFAKMKCPTRILPDFCNDKADSRCTFHHLYYFGGLFYGENHPSKPRDIRLDIPIRKKHSQILNLTWKPPNDSSISYLRGYEITFPQSFPYLYNLTQAHFTTKDSEIVFSFTCEVIILDTIICLNSLPVPKNNIAHCKEVTRRRKYTPAPRNSTVNAVNYTFPSVAVYEHPRASKLWYILIGLSLFILTIVIFSFFILKDILRRRGGSVFEDALEDLNERNRISSDDDETSQEEEEIFV